MLWRFILVNSNNLSHIGELAQASDKKLEVVLGKPGSASFSYPMNADYAALIQPYKTGIKAIRWNRVASLAAGKPVWDCMWSGYVLPIDEDVTNNKMSVACVGWLQRLGRRLMRREKKYNAVDDAVIIRDMIDEANLTLTPDNYAVPIPAGSSPSTPTWLTWGGTQPNEGPGGATAYVATTRSKTVAKYSTMLSVIEEMQSIENGGNIVVDPLTRVVTWHRKYRRVRDDVVFGFQWGPQNARAFNRNIEADAQVNYLVATGAAGTIPQYMDDATQQSEIGLLEESVALSDVRDNDVLLRYAGGEILVRSKGHITYQIQPFPIPYDRPGNVPEAFLDYRVGDQARFTAVHEPRVNIRGQAIRLFGINIDISNDGLATLGPLQVAP
jgi:hypothetical protein